MIYIIYISSLVWKLFYLFANFYFQHKNITYCSNFFRKIISTKLLYMFFKYILEFWFIDLIKVIWIFLLFCRYIFFSLILMTVILKIYLFKNCSNSGKWESNFTFFHEYIKGKENSFLSICATGKSHLLFFSFTFICFPCIAFCNFLAVYLRFHMLRGFFGKRCE